MSFLDTIISTATSLAGSPLTQQALDYGLGLIPPPWGMIVAAAAHGAPTAIRFVQRVAKGETISDEEVAAAWPAIQQECIQVGKDWDQSEAEKTAPQP